MKQWTTGEVAKQRDISTRTLRYYDQINLLTPSSKTAGGKRLYSEDDLFKLEKIIILKSLSLPLAQIRDVLDQLSYKQILISHYNHLQDQLAELETSISKTASLINLIDLETSLSWERVSELVRNSEKNARKWLDYFPEEDRTVLEAVVPSLGNNDDITQQYIALLKRVEWCIERGVAPESTTGRQIATDLNEISNEAFAGDEKLVDQFWEVRKLPVEETGLYPIAEDVLTFVERSVQAVEGAE